MDSNLEMFTEAKEPIYWSTWHSDSPYRNLGKYTALKRTFIKLFTVKVLVFIIDKKKKKKSNCLSLGKWIDLLCIIIETIIYNVDYNKKLSLGYIYVQFKDIQK